MPTPRPLRQLAVLLLPAGTLDHLADAFGQAVAADLEPARGERIGLGDHVEAQIGRIQLELFGDLVQLDFLAEARLRRAVAALGTAGRLVREHPAGIELEARQLVGERRQHAGVEGARRTVGAIGAAVEQGLQVHAGELAVLGHAGAEFHQHRMAAAVQVEHFLARQADFHRPARASAPLWTPRIRDPPDRTCRRSRRRCRRRSRGCARPTSAARARAADAGSADPACSTTASACRRPRPWRARRAAPSPCGCRPRRRTGLRIRGPTAPAPPRRRRIRTPGCDGCCPTSV